MYNCGSLKDRKDSLTVRRESFQETKKAMTEEFAKKKFDMVGCSGQLKDKIGAYEQLEANKGNNLKENPFSDIYNRPNIKKTDFRYGRPKHGSLTEKRGISAGNTISKEIIELCEIIDMCGIPRPDGNMLIRFGQLFQLYTRISDTVVGMLIRARKYGLVDFEGEMLYQRQDEEKIITLLKPIGEIRKSFGQSGDPANCLAKPSKTQIASTTINEEKTTELEK